MPLDYFKLDTDGWDRLEALLNANQRVSRITTHLIEQLRALNARYVIEESEFLNRDFTEAYATYYARTFRRHSKLCRRLSFFAVELESLDALGRLQRASADALEREISDYLGYVVLRPISRAPINEILLRERPSPVGFESRQLVSASFETHVAEAKLVVSGVPATQQDSRIGACAQAAIWSVVRLLHVRRRGPWMTTADITKAALVHAGAANNLHLPAGSEFLTGDNMSAALRSAGREPLFYVRPESQNWGALRPYDIIKRYIDSGIPVIIGINTGGEVGHAVVATGQVLRPTPRSTGLIRPTRAEFCEGFHIHDDQHGSNVITTMEDANSLRESDFNIADHVQYILVPLPSKVYLPAEKAEVVAWDALEQYAADWSIIQAAAPAADLANSLTRGDRLIDQLSQNRVFARTYLTYGWKYKYRAVRNNLSLGLKRLISDLEIPRFVYVTEFFMQEECENLPLIQRRIVAHCVIDATAKNTGFESALLFHAPGFCRRMVFSDAHDLVADISVSLDDQPYFPKVRGKNDFGDFFAAEASS